MKATESGRLWSEQFGAWLGLWEGEYQGIQALWVRLFRQDGMLVPTGEESEHGQAEAEHERAEAERRRAEVEHERAEAERRRAEAAEAEAGRLREELERLKGSGQ